MENLKFSALNELYKLQKRFEEGIVTGDLTMEQALEDVRNFTAMFSESKIGVR
jgi:hypothetical protein